MFKYWSMSNILFGDPFDIEGRQNVGL